MELEQLVIGAPIAVGVGLFTGLAADISYNPDIEFGRIAGEKSASNKDIRQSASSASFYKNLMEIVVTAVIGGGFGKIDESYVNGIAYAAITYTMIKLGELIGRKIRNRARLEPEESEMLAQYAEKLKHALDTSDKSKFLETHREMGEYLESLFDKKQSVVFLTNIIKRMGEGAEAAGYSDTIKNWLKNSPTSLNTPG